MTSFNVNCFFTDPISKYSYMWVDLQHMNFKRGTIQSIVVQTFFFSEFVPKVILPNSRVGL